MENKHVLGPRGSTRRAFLSASAVTAATAAMLREVDPGRIQAIIRRLTQFGTRHTLSSQTDPVRGIGAATAWVLGQMQAIATTSSGRMTVQEKAVVQPAGGRSPTPVTITSVIAGLQGT